MIVLTVVQVLFLHARLTAETGGGRGIRDLALLEAAVARPQATFGGEDLYRDLFTKAAALMESLLLNHPFVDGNKRTAVAAVGLLLRRNGCRLTASNDGVVAFVLQVIEKKPTINDIATWLRSESMPAPESGNGSDDPPPWGH